MVQDQWTEEADEIWKHLLTCYREKVMRRSARTHNNLKVSKCSTVISYQNTSEVNFTRSLISRSFPYPSCWCAFSLRLRLNTLPLMQNYLFSNAVPRSLWNINSVSQGKCFEHTGNWRAWKKVKRHCQLFRTDGEMCRQELSWRRWEMCKAHF